MIRDEAERLAARLQDRFAPECPGFQAAAASSSTRIEFTAPGGARPHIVRYSIAVTLGDEAVRIDLEDAETLLEEAGADWDCARLAAEVRDRALALPDVPSSAHGSEEA